MAWVVIKKEINDNAKLSSLLMAASIGVRIFNLFDFLLGKTKNCGMMVVVSK